MPDKTSSPVNRLILGDNLEIMKTLESESVDLIYLDPPFFSNRNYEVIWGDAGEIRSFQDRWAGGISHYIDWLKERIELMYHLLKPTGSLFLHCDWHANAYIRVDILDRLFGIRNFVNEITWKRTTTHNDTKQGAKHFGRVTDTIFFYAKSIKKFTYNPQFERYTSDYVAQTYHRQDSDGRRFKASDLSAAKPGGDTSYLWKGQKPPQGRYWAYSKENMEQFEKEGRIFYTSTGKPYLKHYLDEMPGVSVDNLWYNCVYRNKEERIGYPTQKPEALMDRIIKVASNEGDMVLDPFMGGGTTAAVADKLGRQWIGIDQSPMAIRVTEMRLNKQQNLFSASFSVQLQKYDYNKLRYEDAFEFEGWIVEKFGGVPNVQKRGDFGVDGKKDGVPIQVKRSEGIGRDVIDKFKSAAERADKKLYDKNIKEKKPVGYIIAFSFGKGLIEEIARLKVKENVIIELVTVDEIVPIAYGPTKITVKIRELSRDTKGNAEIEFTANVQGETEIEIFSWDFDYDAEKGFQAAVMIDKKGCRRHSFKAGTHTVAVKAVDVNGFESLDVFRIKANGGVKKL